MYNNYCKFRIKISTIFVFGWQKTNESPERFAKFWEVEVITPAGHGAEFAGVVARKSLLVALEHFGDIDYFADVDVGQDFHQILKGRRLRLRLDILLVDPDQKHFVNLRIEHFNWSVRNSQVEETVDETLGSELEDTRDVGDGSGLTLGPAETERGTHWRFRISSFTCTHQSKLK